MDDLFCGLLSGLNHIIARYFNSCLIFGGLHLAHSVIKYKIILFKYPRLDTKMRSLNYALIKYYLNIHTYITYRDV